MSNIECAHCEKDTLFLKKNLRQLETLVVQSYETNAHLETQMESLKKENGELLKMLQSHIQKKGAENATLKKKLDEAEDLIAQMQEAKNESRKIITELARDLQETEKLIVILMKEYDNLLLKNFEIKYEESTELLDKVMHLGTSHTNPSQNQMTNVKKKWIAAFALCQIKSKVFSGKADETLVGIAKGKRLRDLSCPTISEMGKELFDPVIPITDALLEANKNLATFLYSQVPQAQRALYKYLVPPNTTHVNQIRQVNAPPVPIWSYQGLPFTFSPSPLVQTIFSKPPNFSPGVPVLQPFKFSEIKPLGQAQAKPSKSRTTLKAVRRHSREICQVKPSQRPQDLSEPTYGPEALSSALSFCIFTEKSDTSESKSEAAPKDTQEEKS